MSAILSALLYLVILKLARGDFSATKEPIKDLPVKFTMKSNSDYKPTPDSWDVNPNLNSLWVYRPPLHSQNEQDSESHLVSLKAPFGLTRLAKPLTFGIDPYFNKGYFEPFERRQKPVTLIAFRRNGLLPKQSIKIDDSKSEEVAEMQSPFNDISSFWQDEPALINL